MIQAYALESRRVSRDQQAPGKRNWAWCRGLLVWGEGMMVELTTIPLQVVASSFNEEQTEDCLSHSAVPHMGGLLVK